MERRETERSAYSRPGFVASAVLVGMLLLAALFIVIGAPSRHEPTAAAAPSAQNKSTAPAAIKDPRPPGCSLPAGSQTVPTVAPVIAWVTVGELAAPQAPRSFGPQHTRDGVGVCFAHNPTGSLLTAINFFAQATVANPTRLLRTLAADTPGRQTAVLEAQDEGDELLQDSDGDPGSVQVTGFQFVDYTPAEASVNVVLEAPGGELASVECQLEWQAGDWKFVIPSGGELDSAPLTSMDGFVSWMAVPGQVTSEASVTTGDDGGGL